MKKPETLTLDEMIFVFGVLVDSNLQDELMKNEKSKNRWALDYVYDSKLREDLEFIFPKKRDAEILNKELNKNNRNEIKIKV